MGMRENQVFGIGLGLGIGGAFVATRLIPTLSGATRPLAKATLKFGMASFEKSREAFAHFGETFDDIVAEARSELRNKVTNLESSYGDGKAIAAENEEAASSELSTQPLSERSGERAGAASQEEDAEIASKEKAKGANPNGSHLRYEAGKKPGQGRQRDKEAH
jgi:hypothetical protein